MNTCTSSYEICSNFQSSKCARTPASSALTPHSQAVYCTKRVRFHHLEKLRQCGVTASNKGAAVCAGRHVKPPDAGDFCKPLRNCVSKGAMCKSVCQRTDRALCNAAATDAGLPHQSDWPGVVCAARAWVTKAQRLSLQGMSLWQESNATPIFNACSGTASAPGWIDQGCSSQTSWPVTSASGAVGTAPQPLPGSSEGWFLQTGSSTPGPARWLSSLEMVERLLWASLSMVS